MRDSVILGSTEGAEDAPELVAGFLPYEELALEVGSLVERKQRAYGDSFGRSGAVLAQLYPTGIPLSQLDDALTIVRVVDKLFRVATAKDALGESPWQDIAGYALLALMRDRRRAGGGPEQAAVDEVDQRAPCAASACCHDADHELADDPGSDDVDAEDLEDEDDEGVGRRPPMTREQAVAVLEREVARMRAELAAEGDGSAVPNPRPRDAEIAELRARIESRP